MQGLVRFWGMVLIGPYLLHVPVGHPTCGADPRANGSIRTIHRHHGVNGGEDIEGLSALYSCLTKDDYILICPKTTAF